MAEAEFREWLAANAHYGREKLAAACKRSTTYVSTVCRRHGVDITAAKRAHGLRRNDTPEGMPPEAPEMPTQKHKTPAALADMDDEERTVAYKLKAKEAQVRALTNQRDLLMADLGRSREFFDEVLAALDVLEPAPLQYRPPPKKASKAPAALVAEYTDAHTGEVVTSAQTSGWGEYNWEIQQRRAARFTEDTLSYLETQRNAYDIRTIHVVMLGDAVSGDIHLELMVTNEWPAPVQVVRGSELYAQQIAALAPHAERVVVDIVTDSNHGRLTKKPQFKNGGTNTHDYTVAEFIKQRLSAHTNVEVNIHVASKNLVQIGGFAFLLEHGDAYLAWNQIPHYGIQRGVRSEAWRRMGHEGLEFDYVMMGHWHTPFSIDGGRVLGIGSPKGTCEFSLKKGYVSQASQTAFLIGRHGVFARTDFNLEDGL